MDNGQILRLNPYQRNLKGRLGRGKDHWAMSCGFADATWADFVTKQLSGALRAHPGGDVLPKDALEIVLSGKVSGDKVHAFVNHNRWVAACECGGVEVVDKGVPFYCFSCFNLVQGGLPRAVAFPPNRDEVEEELVTRDNPLNRNWVPSETPKDLRAENAAHGVGR